MSPQPPGFRWRSMACQELLHCSSSATPASCAQACGIRNILPSSFWWEPMGWPESSNAQRHQSPSQACWRRAAEMFIYRSGGRTFFEKGNLLFQQIEIAGFFQIFNRAEDQPGVAVGVAAVIKRTPPAHTEAIGVLVGARANNILARDRRVDS